MARIVSLGSALQDIFLIDRDDFTPTALGDHSVFGQITIGGKIDIDKISYQVGGGATTAAVAFARGHHQAIFMGSIGRDTAGEAVQALFDEEGVDSSFLNFSKQPTGCSVVLLDAKTGERTTLTHRGASADFSQLDPKDLEIIQPDWLYITSLAGNFDTLEAFLKTARKLNIRTFLNPGALELKHPEKIIQLLPLIDALLLNKSEAELLVPGTNLVELLSRLSSYVPTVLITNNSMGGIATNSHETYRFGIYQDIKVKDTTGAGDAFGAGFLSAILSGLDFKAALIFASANSTSVLSKIGSKQGLLEIDTKLHLMPIQKL